MEDSFSKSASLSSKKTSPPFRGGNQKSQSWMYQGLTHENYQDDELQKYVL